MRNDGEIKFSVPGGVAYEIQLRFSLDDLNVDPSVTSTLKELDERTVDSFMTEIKELSERNTDIPGAWVE